MKIALLVLIPLVIGGLFNSIQAARELPSADMALIELYTRHAAEANQLLGPYSRFGWNHPGPFYFYLLLPAYLLTAQQSWSLYVASSLIAASCVWLLLLLFRKEVSPHAFPFTLLLFGAFILHSGPRVLSFPWNPYVTIIALGLLLSLSAQFALGRWKLFPWILVLGSFITQTHVQYVPVAASFIALAFLFALRNLKPSPKPVIVGLILFLLLWSAPLYQELQNGEGNISKLYSYFNSGVTGTGFTTALSIVGKEAGWGIVSLLSVLPADPGILSFVVLFVGLAVSAFRAIKTDQSFLFYLALLTALSIAVSTWSVTRIPEEIRRSYMHFWISILGLVTYVIVIAILLQKRSPNKITNVSVAVALILFAWLGLKDSLPRSRVASESLKEPAVVLADWYEKGDRAPLKFQIQVEGIWPVVAGVLLQLDKMNVAYCVEDRLLYMFGEALDCDQFARTKLNDVRFSNQEMPSSNPIFRTSGIFIYGSK